MSYSDGPRPVFDDRDAELLAAREAARAAFDAGHLHPRVGDVLIMPDGETRRRVAHVWDYEDGTEWSIQPSAHTDSSFYMGQPGGMSHSGSLDSGIPRSCFTLVPGTANARAWFFHHDFSGAHRGVYFVTPVRQWKVEGLEAMYLCYWRAVHDKNLEDIRRLRPLVEALETPETRNGHAHKMADEALAGKARYV